MDAVLESFAGMPVVRVPYLGYEPIGPDALDCVAEQMRGPEGVGGPDPLGAMTVKGREGLTVRRSGPGYLLTLPLPLASAREVDLKRRDGDLIVAVGEHRRVVRLPPVLRRCVVRSAGVGEGMLRVSFQPDPTLWPSGRLPELAEARSPGTPA